MIDVVGAVKTYEGKRKVTALDGVSFTVAAGEMVAVMGPSGSGKSTLLHLLGGLDQATAGSVRLDGVELTGLGDDALTRVRRDKIGFIFQFFNLLPTLSAFDNVALPMRLQRRPAVEARSRAGEFLELVGLAQRADHLPDELSGGECQRVAIARALVPRFAPSRLPQLGGRWFDTQAAGVELTWGDAAFPPVTWDTLQGGLRGGFRGAHGELRASYFRGFDDAPRITPQLTTLDRSFARLEVSSVDGELLLGAFILRGEAGYFHFPGGADDGYGLFEVEGEWSRASWRVIAAFGDAVGGDPSASAPTALDVALLPALFLHVEKGEATEWQVALDATVGTHEFDHLVRVSGSYPLTGQLRAGGELDLIGGDPSTFWGRWRDNDRLRLFLRFDY